MSNTATFDRQSGGGGMGLSVRFCQLISLLVGPVLIAALQRAGHHSILLLFASPAGGQGAPTDQATQPRPREKHRLVRDLTLERFKTSSTANALLPFN